MCTPYEDVVTRNQVYLADNFDANVLISMFYQHAFLSASDYQRFENMFKNDVYEAASALLDRLKVLPSEDWTQILNIFGETETSKHIVKFIKEKLGMYIKNKFTPSYV
jgi:hypothetical protein